ncbi:hypothetical protein CLOM_g24140 [Closterium sp. NIES-68]|nr:hypothetical protein CLOM_g24140 [Closterium sp. NIES-68]GJP74103.1 hypothetical protein CLOP_g4738 [Closterium sp. NIES-67]
MAPLFPILSAKDLVKRFECIHKLTEDDILRPTADVMWQAYEAIVAFALPRKRNQFVDNAFARSCTDAPETYHESIGIIRLFQSVSRILSAADSSWFTMRDLLKPNSGRTIRALSAFANFYMFIEQYSGALEETVYANREITETKQRLEDKIAEVNTETASQDEQNKEDENEAECFKAEMDALQKKIQAATKQQYKVMESVSTKQEQLKELNAEILAEKGRAVNAKAEAQVLQHQIAQSPTMLEAALKRVEEDIEQQTELKKEEAENAVIFRHKLVMSQNVLEAIKRRDETMELAVIAADRCSNLKSDIQSRRYAIEKLKQRRETLRRKAERIPLEDAIRAKKHEAWNKQLEELQTALEFAKRDKEAMHKELLHGESSFFEGRMKLQREIQEKGVQDGQRRQLYEERKSHHGRSAMELFSMARSYMRRAREEMGISTVNGGDG